MRKQFLSTTASIAAGTTPEFDADDEVRHEERCPAHPRDPAAVAAEAGRVVRPSRRLQQPAEPHDRAHRARGPPPESFTMLAGLPRGAYTIREFCVSHGFSEAMYFKLKQRQLTPDEMSVGHRRLISVEAAARWRRQRERAALADCGEGNDREEAAQAVGDLPAQTT
jgi:hypothetical protein